MDMDYYIALVQTALQLIVLLTTAVQQVILLQY